MTKLLTKLKKHLNPRYCWITPQIQSKIYTILDIGGEGIDSFLAARYLPEARFTALNISDPGTLAPGADFRHTDLDQHGLRIIQGCQFDYVICSHTLEHLASGLTRLTEIADLVAPGGYLYLEWPSKRSLKFPVKGLGLNFYDDPTHVSVIALDQAIRLLEVSGFSIRSAGARRNRMRQMLAPLLLLRSCRKHGRFVLYDFWDWTGYADYIIAQRPEPR